MSADFHRLRILVRYQVRRSFLPGLRHGERIGGIICVPLMPVGPILMGLNTECRTIDRESSHVITFLVRPAAPMTCRVW